MNNGYSLKTPPITEAIFDIKVSPLESSKLNELDISSSIQQDFPKKQVSIEYKGSLQVNNNEEPSQNISKKENGFLFRNNEGTKVIQFRLDGFTFNRVKGYDDWETFKNEALNFLETYKSRVGVGEFTIERIALRYINRIEIREANPDYKDYFKLRPCIPEGFLDLTSFFMQTSFLEKEKNINAQILTTIDQKSKNSNLVPFILDIDVFKEGRIENDKLERHFEELRKLKNQIFFQAITKKCKYLFS